MENDKENIFARSYNDGVLSILYLELITAPKSRSISNAHIYELSFANSAMTVAQISAARKSIRVAEKQQ